MRTISQKQFNELNEYLEYDGVDEEFLTKLRDATGITAKPYVAYNLYDENGNYVGNFNNELYDILRFAGVGIRKENYNESINGVRKDLDTIRQNLNETQNMLYRCSTNKEFEEWLSTHDPEHGTKYIMIFGE